jgi:hypothetical protein
VIVIGRTEVELGFDTGKELGPADGEGGGFGFADGEGVASGLDIEMVG